MTKPVAHENAANKHQCASEDYLAGGAVYRAAWFGHAGRLPFRHWDASGFRFTTDPLPYFEAQALLRARLANAEITKRLTFHSFRAGTITRMLEAGATLDEVQLMANHVQITTTQLYDRRDQNISRLFGGLIDDVLRTK